MTTDSDEKAKELGRHRLIEQQYTKHSHLSSLMMQASFFYLNVKKISIRKPHIRLYVLKHRSSFFLKRPECLPYDHDFASVLPVCRPLLLKNG
nr:hypothetical protein [Bacillus pumilus]